MKVKYLALAVAAACVAPAAQADVTIAGTFAPVMLYTNNGSQDTTAAGAGPLGAGSGALGGKSSFSNFQPDNASNRFSITSTEDLGNGGSAGAFVDIRGAQGGFNNQNAPGDSGLVAFRYGASIGGGWGKLEFGRNFSPYTWTMINNDPHQGAIYFGGYQIIGQAGAQGFWHSSNTTHSFIRTATGVHYFSPDLSGFSFKASYISQGNKTANTATTTGTKETSEVSLSADFAPADMPFYLGAAYSNRKNGNGVAPMSTGLGLAQTQTAGSGSTDTAIMAGGGVKFGDLKVGIWVDQVKYKSDGVTAGLSEVKRTAVWIPVTYALPTGSLGAAYISAGDLKGSNASAGGFNGNDTGAQILQLSYSHNISKQTQALAMWSYTSADKFSLYGAQYGAKSNQVIFGIQHSF
ncbi:MAG: porin [Betaproteobacteria bacterium]|jgi:hypothetical protein|nr:porin [Rhodocyclaceae bacterium]MCA3142258.1 porin [Rhodocyclaceae bacterium]MCA3146453.1 porin [Rhodocyclaceae bacterium]MCE2897251.1 porin [Betaproteobacteria bacterium]